VCCDHVHGLAPTAPCTQLATSPTSHLAHYKYHLAHYKYHFTST
jgi:hypothetical protein